MLEHGSDNMDELVNLRQAYQKPVGNLLQQIYEEDLIRPIHDIKIIKKTCFVCRNDTLFLYPDIKYSSPHNLIRESITLKWVRQFVLIVGLNFI